MRLEKNRKTILEKKLRKSTAPKRVVFKDFCSKNIFEFFGDEFCNGTYLVTLSTHQLSSLKKNQRKRFTHFSGI